MNLLTDILFETFRTLMTAAPFLILGLVIAGLIHVLLPERWLRRWMGRPGLSGAAMASAIGVPLPVCSCGVLPIAIEMRRKGASQPASVGFLITTPESSADSILFTWGLMGPIFAIARPISAFFTAMFGAVASIAVLNDDAPPPPDDVATCGSCGGAQPEPAPSDSERPGPRSLGAAAPSQAPQQPVDPAHDSGHALTGDTEQATRALRGFFLRPFRRWMKPSEPAPGLWKALILPALRYAFVELLDDIAFWLAIGVLAAGVIGAVVPNDLASLGLGQGLLPMLLVLAISTPLYMCASASTPVAAALLAKGFSPGAALVFLLAGPATNAASVILLGKTFGGRFVRVYLLSVVAGSLICGIAFDRLLAMTGWNVMMPLQSAGMSGFSTLEWTCGLVLIGFLLVSTWRGSMRSGFNELTQTFPALTQFVSGDRRQPGGKRRLAVGAAVLLLAAYAATGLRVVPSDSRGYGFVFGKLTWSDLEPGLHYVPPYPIGRWEARRTGYSRKTDVGFQTDLQQLADRRELSRKADARQWHSPVAAMNADAFRSSYITADENLVDVSFSVHYGLSEPVKFFYSIDHTHNPVGLYAETAARDYIASQTLTELLDHGRGEIQREIGARLRSHLERLDLGIELQSVEVVDIHPPSGAVFAFRDVSSAREDRETLVHRAREKQAMDVPLARAEAARIVGSASAQADARIDEASGRAEAFSARTDAVSGQRALMMDLLWRESATRVLSGREKFVVPSGKGARGVSLWRDMPADPPADRGGNR